MSSFGNGLGTVVGSSIAAGDLTTGLNAINANTQATEGATQPFVQFGQSFLPSTGAAINNLQATAGQTQGYNQFMSGYTNTPAVQYQLQQADATTNSSAAANGQLLSGSNLRNLQTINNGIISTGANNAYNEYLAGNNQQFGQLNSALGDMFNAIGVGTTATGQDVSLTNSLNQATASQTQAQAKNAQAKGSGLGSMFTGLGNFVNSF